MALRAQVLPFSPVTAHILFRVSRVGAEQYLLLVVAVVVLFVIVGAVASLILRRDFRIDHENDDDEPRDDGVTSSE